MHRRLTARIGNRGVALVMLGSLWILTALGLVVAPLKRTTLLDERLPIWLRICLWAVPGAVAIYSAVRKKWDAEAWGLLCVPAAIRFFSFLAGWLISLLAAATNWHFLSKLAYPDGWRGATAIAVFVVFIRVCAAGLDRLPPASRSEE
jgi:hypothetical protein